MPHVDEGTLHALLDGELAPEALAEVRIHFATCPTCAARLDEARQLLAETERLVSALQLPGGAAPRAAPQAAPQAAPAAAVSASAVADSVLMPPSPGSLLPPLDPVVLIPENPTVRELRRGRLRAMAWAAGFLVVVGAGYLGVVNFQTASRPSDGQLRLLPDEFTTTPVPTEREGADSTPTLGLTDAPGAAPARAESAASTPAPAPAAAPAAKPKTESARAAAPTAPPASPPPPAPARADEKRAAAEPQLAKAAEAVEAAPRDNAAPPPEARQPASVDRSPAAQATFELDRRRTRARAAEATAALDRDRELAARRAAEERERQLAAERAAGPAAAPARPAVDARTGISSRIGLDEAARQLGGPLHAIDGLSRQTVGLVPGTSVEGADPARPVVRAVYVDRASGTMLFLDQQMAQPGKGPATPQTGRSGRQVWVKDGVLLVLHGDLSADSLRSLARRVR